MHAEKMTSACPYELSNIITAVALLVDYVDVVEN